jgi:hypothetical protein
MFYEWQMVILQMVVEGASNGARRCYRQDSVFVIFVVACGGMLQLLFFLLQSFYGFATMVQNYCYGVSDEDLQQSRCCYNSNFSQVTSPTMSPTRSIVSTILQFFFATRSACFVGEPFFATITVGFVALTLL